MAERQRKRRHQLEVDEPHDKPVRYTGVVVKIKPTMYAVCAGCGWSHATLSYNDNAWHQPCLEAWKREYHPVPDKLMKDGRA